MLRIISELRPAWCVIENVPALRLRGADTVLLGLEELGYVCWPIVVGAWAVGAPHKRDRVWIVAHPHRERGFMADTRSERRQQIPRSAHGNESADEGWAAIQTDESDRDGQGNRARD